MTEEKKNQQEETQDVHQETTKSPGRFGQIIKGAGGVIKGATGKITNFAKEQYEKIKNSRDFQKEFNNKTYEFNIEGTKETFRAFKNPNENILFFLAEDTEIPILVKSNVILIRNSDSLKLKVVSVETKNPQSIIICVNEKNISLSVFLIYTKAIEEEKISSVVNNVNQSLIITGSTIHGDIQQINDLTNKLNEFESHLKSFKPGLFNKNVHTDALKIYGDVKDSIINGKKDASIVHKFLDLLGKLGGPLISIFSKIIG